MVYFICEAGRMGNVKIGHSIDPQERCDTLQVGNPNPLHVHAALPGGEAVEGRLHDRFAAGRMAGEWFRHDTPGLGDFLFDALVFDAMWPEDIESPAILEVLSVIVPNRAHWPKYIARAQADLRAERLEWERSHPGVPF